MPRSRPTTISSHDCAGALGDRTVVGGQPAQMVGERADRRDDVERVAVGLHDQRRRDTRRPVRRAATDVRATSDSHWPGHPGLQVLQEHSVIAIRRSVIGVVQQPAVVGRQPVLHREDHAAELARRDAHALLADAARPSDEAPAVRERSARTSRCSPGFRRSGVGVVCLRPRQRVRVVDLPRQRRAQLGVLGQQVEQDRGAGARLARR